MAASAVETSFTPPLLLTTVSVRRLVSRETPMRRSFGVAVWMLPDRTVDQPSASFDASIGLTTATVPTLAVNLAEAARADVDARRERARIAMSFFIVYSLGWIFDVDGSAT